MNCIIYKSGWVLWLCKNTAPTFYENITLSLFSSRPLHWLRSSKEKWDGVPLDKLQTDVHLTCTHFTLNDCMWWSVAKDLVSTRDLIQIVFSQPPEKLSLLCRETGRSGVNPAWATDKMPFHGGGCPWAMAGWMQVPQCGLSTLVLG